MMGVTVSSYKRSVNLEKDKFDLFKLIRLSEMTGYSLDDLCGLTHEHVKLNNYQKEMAEAVYNYICDLKRKKR